MSEERRDLSGVIPAGVRTVLETLLSAGHEAWCVGGCVRDTLLGRAPEDWDVTTSALPEETLSLFPGALPTGLRHGTVTVGGGRGVEVTTYRCDGPYTDHRRPDQVTFTRSLTEDLARRDFTVNAMALSVRGELRDPFGGQADLRGRVLRCVGRPEERFREDALRMLRALRFSAVLGFTIQEDTAAAIHKTRDLLRFVAPERIQTELFKLLSGPGAAEALRRFPDAVGVFWPEILPMLDFDLSGRDLWAHTLRTLESAPPDLTLRLALLLRDVGEPASLHRDAEEEGLLGGHGEASARLAEELLQRLRTATALRERVVRLIAARDTPVPRTERALRQLLFRLGEEETRLLFALQRADCLAQAPASRERLEELRGAEALLEKLLREGVCFSPAQLAVKGRDLLALGLPPGPALGRLLDALFARVLEGALPNRREDLLKEAQRLLRDASQEE